MPRQMLSRGIPLTEPRVKTHSSEERLAFRMEEAVVARITGREPAQYARQFEGMTLLDIAENMLAERGVGGGTTDILAAAVGHGAGDFPNLLRRVGSRVLAEMYEAAPSYLRSVSRRRRGATDFRPLTRLRLGEYPELLEVDDLEEVKQGTTGEAVESFSVKQFARKFTLGRKAIYNDDLGAFSDWTRAMAQVAIDCEARELTKILAMNNWRGPTMEDGKPLFDPTHGNMRSAAGLLEPLSFFDEGRQAMRRQKGVGGTQFINIAPSWVIVPETRETAMEQALVAITPTRADDANPFAGKLSLGVEPRIPSTRSYLFADPNRSPVLEYAFLDDSSGPEIIQTSNEDGVLGLTFMVIHDFGCGAVDWRGAFMDEKTEGGGNA